MCQSNTLTGASNTQPASQIQPLEPYNLACGMWSRGAWAGPDGQRLVQSGPRHSQSTGAPGILRTCAMRGWSSPTLALACENGLALDPNSRRASTGTADRLRVRQRLQPPARAVPRRGGGAAKPPGPGIMEERGRATSAHAAQLGHTARGSTMPGPTPPGRPGLTPPGRPGLVRTTAAAPPNRLPPASPPPPCPAAPARDEGPAAATQRPQAERGPSAPSSVRRGRWAGPGEGHSRAEGPEGTSLCLGLDPPQRAGALESTREAVPGPAGGAGREWRPRPSRSQPQRGRAGEAVRPRPSPRRPTQSGGRAGLCYLRCKQPTAARGARAGCWSRLRACASRCALPGPGPDHAA